MGLLNNAKQGTLRHKMLQGFFASRKVPVAMAAKACIMQLLAKQ
jgi:hypothetical protein